MPVALPNIPTSDNYPAPGSSGAQIAGRDIFASGWFTVANNSVICEYLYGTQGQNKSSPEFFLAPGSYPLASSDVNPISGIRFRSAVAGKPAQVWGAFFYKNDPILSSSAEFTGTVSASGSVTNPTNNLVGEIKLWPALVVPANFLACDGSAVARVGTFAGLFAVIGTTYGIGDGATTFNVPDLQGRVPVGLGTNAAVNVLNKNDGQVVANRRPLHRTTLTDPGHNHTHTDPGHNHTHNDPGHTHTESGFTTPATQAAVAGGGTDGFGVENTSSSVTGITNNANTTGVTNNSNTTGITSGSGVGTDALDSPSYIVAGQYIIAIA